MKTRFGSTASRGKKIESGGRGKLCPRLMAEVLKAGVRLSAEPGNDYNRGHERHGVRNNSIAPERGEIGLGAFPCVTLEDVGIYRAPGRG